ncbi:MAG: 50S ribosomal protein L3 [bacterium]
MNAVLGKKLGMTRIFASDGSAVPVTVLSAGPNVIVQVKTVAKEGYNAVQVGFEQRPERTARKPLLGHIRRAKIAPPRRLGEVRVESTDGFEPGQVIGADLFKVGDLVDISGISKGLGFQGGVRRHGFSGGSKTHGQSDRWRAPGSLGQSSYPSRVFKGLRMAGHMGNEKTTVRNLRVEIVDAEKNIIAVRGAVPGKRNSYVKIKKR